MSEEEQSLHMTADEILSDIFNLALTNMLLQAEVGKDTDQILSALNRIKVPAGDNIQSEYDILLWEPKIPGASSSKKGAKEKKLTFSTDKNIKEHKRFKKPKDDDETEVTRL